jgi:hypothetical protein
MHRVKMKNAVKYMPSIRDAAMPESGVERERTGCEADRDHGVVGLRRAVRYMIVP